MGEVTPFVSGLDTSTHREHVDVFYVHTRAVHVVVAIAGMDLDARAWNTVRKTHAP